ncbi:MAG: hypothetical protein O7G87_20935, partial [bacterium]|nr:hypothetical protein [bacterium]
MPCVVFGDTETVSPDSSMYVHNPYDLTQIGMVDSTDVYVTRKNHLLKLPSYLWMGLVYPLGEFAIYAEHAKLWNQYYKLFTNKDGTFGLFPQFQLGGETGTGGGARIFHTNLAGKGKVFTGFYVYSGGTGQTGEALYVDPNLLGSGLIWQLEGGYLRTRNRSANINAAVRKNPSRLFEIEQTDVLSRITWHLHRGPQAPYLKNWIVEGEIGFGRRDFQINQGTGAPLFDPGSTGEARQIRGLGQVFDLYRIQGRLVYDGRDYRSPVRELTHPLNYQLPG